MCLPCWPCAGICRRKALDDSLTRWGNVSTAVNNTHPRNFRDPARPWQGADGRWYLVVGSGLTPTEKGPVAQAWLYRASDSTLAKWEFLGVMLEAKTSIGGHVVDTFDCDDIWPLPDGRVVFKASMGSDVCVPPACHPAKRRAWNTHGDEYFMGRLDYSSNSPKLTVEARGLVDHGDYYTSKSCSSANQTGRRVLFGWVDPFTNRLGDGSNEWNTRCGSKTSRAGALSPEALPRELITRPDGTVMIEPVRELSKLRVYSTELRYNTTLRCGHSIDVGDLGHQVEIRAVFSASSAATQKTAAFGIRVLSSLNGSEATEVGINRTDSFVNKTVSTRRNATPPIFLDVMKAPTSSDLSRSIAVFADGQLLESFFDGKALTTQVFPSSEVSTHFGLFMRCESNAMGMNRTADSGIVHVDVQAWALRPITIKQKT